MKPIAIKFISGSILDFSWMKKITSTNPRAVLIVASGLFYYFTKDSIIDLICAMKNNFETCELVFDAVCKKRIKKIKPICKKNPETEKQLCIFMLIMQLNSLIKYHASFNR